MLSTYNCNILRHEVYGYFESTLSVPNIVLTANLNSMYQPNFVFELGILSLFRFLYYRIVSRIPLLFLYYPFLTKFLSQLLFFLRIYRP